MLFYSFNGFANFSLIQDNQDLLQLALVEADIDTDLQPDLEAPGQHPVVIISPEDFEQREHEEQNEEDDEDVGVRKHLNPFPKMPFTKYLWYL